MEKPAMTPRSRIASTIIAAFAGLEISPTEYGPMIAGCVAYLACTVRDTVSAGDHDVYVAEVEAGEIQGSAKPYVHTRKSGLTY